MTAMADEENQTADSKSSSSSKRSRKGQKESKNADTRSRSGHATGGLALMIAAIALIGAGYLWYTLLFERADLLTTDVVGGLQKLKQETDSLRENVAESNTILDDLQANQNNIRSALDKIQNDISRHRTEWVLAESEQLLVIANNRLQLARDVRSALAALRAADVQLNQITTASLLPVRRDLAREIAALDAIDKVDINGISLKLGSLAEIIDRLPVAPDVLRRAQAASTPIVAADAGKNGWRTQVRDLWHDLLSLVRVRHDVTAQRPLLPPEQEYFLRENLKLTLYGAQFALLQGNVAVFQQNVKNAQQLLKDYYDGSTQVVAGAQAELEKMRASKIVAELPDISRSLSALRNITTQRSTP